MPDNQGEHGDPKSTIFLCFIPLEVDIEGVEMTSKWSKMHPNPHFLSDFDTSKPPFCRILVGLPGCFRGFSAQKTHKSGQLWTKKQLPKRPVAACKCWQSAFFQSQKCTLPYPCTPPIFFLYCWGGWRLSSAVRCSLTATAAGLCCSAHGLSEYAFQFSSTNRPTKHIVKYYVTFYH